MFGLVAWATVMEVGMDEEHLREMDQLIRSLERAAGDETKMQRVATWHSERFGWSEEEALQYTKKLFEDAIQYQRGIKEQTPKWLPVYLKLEEAQFFLDQVSSHQRHPKLLFFYLSAFLAAARSTTFHVQKQFVGGDEDTRALYEAVKAELLGDAISRFFIDLRNVSEKEHYPDLVFTLRKPVRDGQGNVVWAKYCSVVVDGPTTVSRAEQEMNKIRPEEARFDACWEICGFKDKQQRELVPTCHEYLANLYAFVDRLRMSAKSGS